MATTIDAPARLAGTSTALSGSSCRYRVADPTGRVITWTDSVPCDYVVLIRFGEGGDGRHSGLWSPCIATNSLTEAEAKVADCTRPAMPEKGLTALDARIVEIHPA